tara:strand:+ start:321 stop:887 length:567 start_codon:yes stop_codon:yes gene_type:complete
MSNIFFDIARLKYLGKNVILGKTVRIRKPEEVTIGDESIIDDFTYISCAMDLGNNSHIASNVSISGGALGKKFTMGSYSTISNGSSIHCASSDYRKCSLELPSMPPSEQAGGIAMDICVGDYVTIGAHSCVLPGVIIPEGVAFGAYTLIKPKKLLPYHLYVGVECRDLGVREDIDIIIKHKENKRGRL